MPLVDREVGHVARRRAGLPEEGQVVAVERVPAGDADDRVALGLGEPPLLVHALDIHDARPGGSLDLGRREVGVLDLKSTIKQCNSIGREFDTGGKAAVYHEPGGKRDIGLIVLLKVIADGTDVAGTPGVEPPEGGNALDGAVVRIPVNVDDLPGGEGSAVHLIGRHVEVRPKTGHPDLDGLPGCVPSEDVNDRGGIGTDAVLHLMNADTHLPEVVEDGRNAHAGLKHPVSHRISCRGP